MKNYASVFTASGSTKVNLTIEDDTFTLMVISRWMGGTDLNFKLNGLVRKNSANMCTLNTCGLRDNLTGQYLEINKIDDDYYMLSFRLLDVGGNVKFDMQDNVSGCVLAGNGIFNTCWSILQEKCKEKNCNKCFTYNTILIACDGNTFDENPTYKKYAEVLKYHLLRSF